MKKKNLIKIVDVDEVIKPQKICYNKSLLSIEHDEPCFSYWPVNNEKELLNNIDNARYKTLSEFLR